MGKIVLTAVAGIIAMTGMSFAAEKVKTASGSELLEKHCSACHPSTRAKEAKKTSKQWEATVTRMMEKGAELTADEKKILIKYLAKTYKP